MSQPKQQIDIRNLFEAVLPIFQDLVDEEGLISVYDSRDIEYFGDAVKKYCQSQEICENRSHDPSNADRQAVIEKYADDPCAWMIEHSFTDMNGDRADAQIFCYRQEAEDKRQDLIISWLDEQPEGMEPPDDLYPIIPLYPRFASEIRGVDVELLSAVKAWREVCDRYDRDDFKSMIEKYAGVLSGFRALYKQCESVELSCDPEGSPNLVFDHQLWELEGTDILTRFANEIGGVDVERNTCINILGKLGTLFQECVSYEQSGFDQEPEERFDGDKWKREGIKIITAAIKQAGGKK